MPYPYSYFKPTGKEQGAMAIGSLLAGLLAAGQPRQPGEASPALKGIAGAVGGYGSGYKAYQDMMGDAFTRDLYDRKYNQDVNQFDQQMGLNREKFGEEKRQFEEIEKPYKESQMRWNDAMSKNYDFDNQMAFDKRIQERLNSKKNERFNNRVQQLEMRKLKNAVVASRPGAKTAEIKPPKMPDVGNYAKLKAQLAALKSTGNMDYIGMPENERASTIADLENAIRVMGQHQPELIPPQQQTQQIPQQGDVIARHQNDPVMQGTELGKLTPQGYEVYKNGKLVGHYQ